MLRRVSKNKNNEKQLTQNSLSLKLPYRQQERSVIATSGEKRWIFLFNERISRRWHHFYHKSKKYALGHQLLAQGVVLRKAQNMLLKRQTIYTVLAWILMGVFLIFSNPNKLPVVVLIVPFLLLFIALYCSWILVRGIISRYLPRDRPNRHLGLAVCVSAVLFLVLQSLGQLSLRDVLTIAAIIVVGYLYLGRISISLRRH